MAICFTRDSQVAQRFRQPTRWPEPSCPQTPLNRRVRPRLRGRGFAHPSRHRSPATIHRRSWKRGRKRVTSFSKKCQGGPPTQSGGGYSPSTSSQAAGIRARSVATVLSETLPPPLVGTPFTPGNRWAVQTLAHRTDRAGFCHGPIVCSAVFVSTTAARSDDRRRASADRSPCCR